MLRINRKAHIRRAYAKIQRGKHLRIHGTRVKATTFLAKDRGHRGRTPLAKRWSRKVKFHKMKGYNIDLPAKKRLAALRKNIKKRGGGRKGARSTMRTLQAVINVNPSRKSDRIMKADINKIWRK